MCNLLNLLLVFFQKTLLKGTEFIQHNLQLFWLRKDGRPIIRTRKFKILSLLGRNNTKRFVYLK